MDVKEDKNTQRNSSSNLQCMMLFSDGFVFNARAKFSSCIFSVLSNLKPILSFVCHALWFFCIYHRRRFPDLRRPRNFSFKFHRVHNFRSNYFRNNFKFALSVCRFTNANTIVSQDGQFEICHRSLVVTWIGKFLMRKNFSPFFFCATKSWLRRMLCGFCLLRQIELSLTTWIVLVYPFVNRITSHISDVIHYLTLHTLCHPLFCSLFVISWNLLDNFQKPTIELFVEIAANHKLRKTIAQFQSTHLNWNTMSRFWLN